jgi:hypothetical protein
MSNGFFACVFCDFFFTLAIGAPSLESGTSALTELQLADRCIAAPPPPGMLFVA